MGKVGTSKNMPNFMNFGSCKNTRTLRSHYATHNLVWTKPKLLDLNCCVLILTLMPFVSRGNSEFIMSNNQQLTFGLYLFINGVISFL